MEQQLETADQPKPVKSFEIPVMAFVEDEGDNIYMTADIGSFKGKTKDGVEYSGKVGLGVNCLAFNVDVGEKRGRYVLDLSRIMTAVLNRVIDEMVNDVHTE